MSKGTMVKCNGRPRILGASLGSHIGQRVTIFGEIISVGSDKKKLQIRTTDAKVLDISLNDYFTSPDKGCVEIHGTPRSATTLDADYHCFYPPEAVKSFSNEDYNALITSVGGSLGSEAIVFRSP